MRLIDADKIPWTDLNDNPNSNIRVLVTFAEKVNRMPTIEERKTGRWIVYPAPDEQHCGLVKCPYCQEELIAEPTEYHYCPSCGAKMEVEHEQT